MKKELIKELLERTRKALNVLLLSEEKIEKVIKYTVRERKKGERELVITVGILDFIIVKFRYLREDIIEIRREKNNYRKELSKTRLNKLTLEQKKAINELAIIAGTPFMNIEKKYIPQLTHLRLKKLDKIIEKEGLKIFEKSYKRINFPEPVVWEFIEYRVEGANIIPLPLEVEIDHGWQCPVCGAIYPARWEAKSCQLNGHIGKFDNKLVAIARGKI